MCFRKVSFAAALIASVIVVSVGVASADEQVTPGTSHHYYYFDQPVSLGLEMGKVAVLEKHSDLAGPRASTLNETLAGHGFAESDLTKTAVDRLSYAATAASITNEAQLRDLVTAMALDDRLGFVSPVFLDELGGPVLITSYLHIGFHDEVSAAEAEEILSMLVDGEIEARHWSGMKNVFRVKCTSRNGFEVLELANSLAENPDVSFAEPDMFMTARRHLTPNDPYYSSLWGLHNTGQSGGTSDMDMDAPEAWDFTTGDSGIKVVVLDDGTQQNHPDINQVTGVDFTGSGTGGGPGNICDNHGTAVAGCVAATINNSTGVVGIAPGCKVAAAKFTISNTGSPCPNDGTYQVSWLVDALDWAQTSGARVTNNSNGLGSSSSITSKYSSTRSAGIIHFSSSGNSGGSGIGYPASLSTVVAVGACDRDGDRASFSTYGTGLAFVAPGQSIWTTDRTGSSGYDSGDYDSVDGTSFSSPYAAGVAALILSANSSLTPDEVETIMNDTCMDRGSSGYDTYYGYGILNANDALALASVSANNHCENAISICPGDGPYTGTTSGADSQGSAGCGDSSSSPDVWYRYKASADGSVTVHACDTNEYDGVLSAHSGCPGTSSNQVACDDDGCGSGGGPSTITFSVSEGDTYYIRVSGWQGANGNFTLNITGTPCDVPDTEPPLPDPLGIESGSSSSPTEVTLTAYTAIDADSPPVQYRFACTGGSCHSSTWSSSRTYVDSGLEPNHSYSYKTQARDSAAVVNETDLEFAPVGTVATLALVPGTPILDDVVFDSMTIDVVPDDDAMDNPSWTDFAIRCTSSTDSNWSGKYVTTSGGPSDTAVWERDSTWGVKTIVGLQPGTSYTFAVKAMNLDDVETAFGSSATETTPAAPNGACCLGDTSCQSLTESACDAAGGSFLGSGVACGVDPCAPVPSPAVIVEGYPDSYGSGPTEVTITAQMASDATPPIEYRFTCVAGSCNSTTWVSSNVYLNEGLEPNRTYSYKVQARDSMDPPNETSLADAIQVDIASAALVPGAPVLSGPTDYTMTIDVVPDDDVLDNPSWTQYAIQCTDTADGNWDGKYAAADGTVSATAVWQSDSGWGSTVLQGMQPGTPYTFAVKAKNLDGLETVFGSGTTLSTTGAASGACCMSDASCQDLVESACDSAGGDYKGDGSSCSLDPCPPVPNPAVILDGYPDTYGSSPTEVTVTAQVATDANPPIEYRFDCVSGACHDRDWASSRVYVDTGLSPNQTYGYKAQARDSMSPPNETDLGLALEVSVTTAALVPGAPILGTPTDFTMTIDVVPDDDVLNNPSWTEFAIQCTSSADGNWDGKYVAAGGTPVSGAVWQTDAAWGVTTLLGMQPGTSYTFAVKARNLDALETAFGTGGTESTSNTVTGACCVENTCDIETPDDCLLASGEYQGDDTVCSPNPCCAVEADVNGDLELHGDDVQCFIDCLVGSSPAGCQCACADLDGSPGLDMGDVPEFVARLLGL